MTYGLHPSQQLRALFDQQQFPHQGQDPRRAQIVVLGLDANYSPEISTNSTFFKKIVAYHEDGIRFWREHKVHHPFLLPEYPLKKNTGGVPYHRRFSWMGLTPEYAPHISFIELLDVPTTGRTERNTFWTLFSIDHARRIDDLVAQREQRLIIVSKSLVSNYMLYANRNWQVFDWLPGEFHVGKMKTIGETVIMGAPHFSSTTYKKVVFHELGDQIRAFVKV